jgi:hypothetical protein
LYGWNIPAGQGSHCASTHEKRWPAAQDRTSGDDARVTCTIFTVRITAAPPSLASGTASVRKSATSAEWLACRGFNVVDTHRECRWHGVVYA